MLLERKLCPVRVFENRRKTSMFVGREEGNDKQEPGLQTLGFLKKWDPVSTD